MRISAINDILFGDINTSIEIKNLDFNLSPQIVLGLTKDYYRWKNGCIECGEKNPVVLQIHKKHPGVKSIRDITSVESFLAAMDTGCYYVICGNCSSKHKYLSPDDVNGWNKGHTCVLCNEDDPRCIVFHHIGTKKLGNFNHILQTGYRRGLVIKELHNCKPVCVNCHTILHDNSSSRVLIEYFGITEDILNKLDIPDEVRAYIQQQINQEHKS